MGSVWFGSAGWCRWRPGWGEIFVSVAVELQANSHTHKHAQTKPNLCWWNSRAHSIVRTSVNMAVCTLKETSVTNISGDSLRFKFAQVQADELADLSTQPISEVKASRVLFWKSVLRLARVEIVTATSSQQDESLRSAKIGQNSFIVKWNELSIQGNDGRGAFSDAVTHQKYLYCDIIMYSVSTDCFQTPGQGHDDHAKCARVYKGFPAMF